MTQELEQLQRRLREFARVRAWEQFHSPKNLATALVVEAAELVEPFQWLSEEQSRRLSPEQRVAVEHELADVFIYLTRLADLLNVDLFEAAERKIALNEQRYPVAQVRGRSDKRGR